ncbi:hypothetical protein [Sodalis sp. (in: enterobacteria)]|uniref:hypothetical protein n=1 Tax=Sodalis sp. (in: enterobacteria) TaxID=1898979 RepID=UPI003F682649
MQITGVEAQVIINKAGDEEIAVVIARLDTQRQRPLMLARQRGPCFRLQLFRHERIGIALIY